MDYRTDSVVKDLLLPHNRNSCGYAYIGKWSGYGITVTYIGESGSRVVWWSGSLVVVLSKVSGLQKQIGRGRGESSIRRTRTDYQFVFGVWRAWQGTISMVDGGW